MNLSFREAGRADAAALASLSGELGYPVSAVEMEGRLELMAKNTDHVVLVACDGDGAAGGGAVIGWIDLGTVLHLQSGRYCEIGGLVVTASARGKGTGRALVAQAEKWAAARGLARVLVRSNAVREGAHRFYIREGYRRTKTSAVFEKSVGGAGASAATPGASAAAPAAPAP